MINSFIQAAVKRFCSTYLDPSLKVLKLRAAIYYLEGIRGTHRILILISLLVFVITLIGAGLVMIPVSLLLFAPWDPATKAIVGVIIGGLYLLVPAFALVTLLSEKRWMRITGATEVLRKLAD